MIRKFYLDRELGSNYFHVIESEQLDGVPIRDRTITSTYDLPWFTTEYESNTVYGLVQIAERLTTGEWREIKLCKLKRLMRTHDLEYTPEGRISYPRRDES